MGKHLKSRIWIKRLHVTVQENATNAGAEPKKTRRRRTRNRRAELLDIAARLFAENGFTATTMTQISDAAGILSGSLYHHFSTKEDIFHELMRPFGEALVKGFQEAALNPGTAEQNLTNMLRHSYETLIENRDRHMILYSERRLIRRTPEFQYITYYGEEINRIVYSVLQQGVREGIIRHDVNLALAASMLLRLTNVLVDTFEPGGRFKLEELFELERSLVMDGLRKRD